MRKRWISALVCLAVGVSACTAALAAGGADDPLISASWLYETLLPRLAELCGMETKRLDEQAAEYAARMDCIAGTKDESFAYCESLTPLALQSGDMLTLDDYGLFLLEKGTARLRCEGCEVLDLSNGSVCADGCWLVPMHRYFSAEGSGAHIRFYSAAEGCVDGYYRNESGSVFPLEDRYVDIDNHWAEQDILRMTERNVVNGMSNYRFEPETKVSRAMFVTVLGRLLGADHPASGPRVRFADVAEGTWYAEYVSWAASLGLVNGYGNGLFGPDDLITREQMAVILIRSCNVLGIRLPDTDADVYFTDRAQISSWALEAVINAQLTGMMSRRASGAFDPATFANRAEMCTVLCRLSELAA